MRFRSSPVRLAACSGSPCRAVISKPEEAAILFRLFAALTLVFVALPAHAEQSPKLKTVASFSILADFVRNVGGERVDVVTLVGPDSDAHVFAPTPADARKVAEAKLVFVNGLGFEGWMARLAKAAGGNAVTVTAAAGVKTLKIEDSHGHGATDPHAWQSVTNAKIYVANIRDALVKADPDGKSAYEANAKTYLDKLDTLDAEVKAAVARIPADRRRIITTHDAFGYFAAAYGVQFVAPAGVSTDAEASARDVASIIRQIKKQKIPAVFLENVTNARLMGQIARESGAKIGGKLYSDALSAPDGPAPTYIDMMRHNIGQLSTALLG
jgi:zinc/manganese transport system substrate-binding protein